SGRSHRVYTGVTLVTPKGGMRHRLVETRVRFKRLSREEIEAYLASGEWRGKAGGYAIQGLAGSFVVKLVGSYTNVVGLPLYETVSLLTGEGYPPVECPNCGTSSNRETYPFCSKRCADIDLNRWFSGAYAVPSPEPVDEDYAHVRDEESDH
ncbi:unnamed protein product, partial [Cyprideis torosa]